MAEVVLDSPDAGRREAAVSAATTAILEQFRAISTIFDAVDAAVYVADLHTHELLFVNAYVTRVWGEGVVGKRCYEVLQAGQTGPCAFCTNDRLVQDGRPGPAVVWEFQNTVTKSWYQCIDQAIPWLDGRLVRMEVAVEITKRKLAEAFREQYVSLVSHDLKNPLSALTLRAQSLRRKLDRMGLAEEARSLDTVLKSARRMDAMIGDLVETTRLEGGELVLHRDDVDLAALAREVAARSGSDADVQRVAVESTGPVVARVDAARIERVLENVLANALRYSPPGSPVEIRLELREGEAVVAVRDRGFGIPAGELPRLFARFFRASTARHLRGLGLGLYNSRLIVERHGGRIWAESEVGAGSVFRFALPVVPPA